MSFNIHVHTVFDIVNCDSGKNFGNHECPPTKNDAAGGLIHDFRKAANSKFGFVHHQAPNHYKHVLLCISAGPSRLLTYPDL